MAVLLPRKIKNFAVVNDGNQTAGTIDEFSIPKLSRKMEEYRGGGMSGPIKVDLGMEHMEASFNCAEWSEKILEQFGLCNSSGVPLRLSAYHERDDSDCGFDLVEVVLRGRWSELDFGALKAGEMNNQKVTMPLTYFKYMQNSIVIAEIEPLGMKENIGGKDRLLERRIAIGL